MSAEGMERLKRVGRVTRSKYESLIRAEWNKGGRLIEQYFPPGIPDGITFKFEGVDPNQKLTSEEIARHWGKHNTKCEAAHEVLASLPQETNCKLTMEDKDGNKLFTISGKKGEKIKNLKITYF